MGGRCGGGEARARQQDEDDGLLRFGAGVVIKGQVKPSEGAPELVVRLPRIRTFFSSDFPLLKTYACCKNIKNLLELGSEDTY